MSGGAAKDLLRVPLHELLALDLPRVRKLLASWTRSETLRTGLGRLVVGLSGGVDSALAAAIAAEAIGPENVLAVRLPYRTSSRESLDDAAEVARRLGIRTEDHDISPAVDAFLRSLGGDLPSVRSGNVQARARMIVLYDLSARDRALVLGTSNKTEILLGYSTLWGDSACALDPIGDLFKTQVWMLAEEMGLPERVVRKAPSAELWAGQTDEGEMGFSYADADRVLHLLVDLRHRREDLVALGFDAALVERIWGMVVRSQFKRRPPLLPKISPRTPGFDFRYPRDWGT